MLSILSKWSFRLLIAVLFMLSLALACLWGWSYAEIDRLWLRWDIQPSPTHSPLSTLKVAQVEAEKGTLTLQYFGPTHDSSQPGIEYERVFPGNKKKLEDNLRRQYMGSAGAPGKFMGVEWYQVGNTWIWVLPMWMLVVAFALLPSAWAIGRVVRRVQPTPGRCFNCGYNLTGNLSGVCPECGTAILPRQSHSTTAKGASA